MLIDVIFLPQLLLPHHLTDRAVVVLDVLRATTTIAAALDAGARQIHVFSSVEDLRDELRTVRSTAQHSILTCGEEQSLRPDGFDLGNSPREFTAERCAGKTIHLATTNGTRAMLEARGASRLFAGALVNASATARQLAQINLDVTLLCAGTGGAIASEDLIGAGAILRELNRLTSNKLESDSARIALDLFTFAEISLPQALRRTTGGQNVIAVGLEPDIDFAARLNVFDCAAEIDPAAMRIVHVPAD